MSKEIDEKVVSMKFDNKNFEANAQTSLGTLDKLKQKLNLSGATKGLESVGAATKKVDMSGLASGIETVRTRFSALEIMGVTALANITNQAVNAGKRIVSSLTIDPVKSGFSEYEMKMDSVKTIMASTGESVETVNKYLEELNAYSDQTIYSFSDMTKNIGKFTNAGVGLEDAVNAIKGISNEAAVSGASAEEASRAMYNFAQALSAGSVKLIDWKSIENANMATVEFKEQLIETAVELGTLTKQGDMYVSTTTDMQGKVSEAFTSTKYFNESLSHQWMTTDVLIKTLGDYANSETEIGKKAFSAAQDVTKLSQMFDVLKETAQSGWAKTWEIIFGNINTAKSIFTPLTDFFSKIINSFNDFRNTVLEGALGNPFESLIEKLDASPFGKMATAATDAADKLNYYQDVVSKVWNGDYKNAPVRYQLLDDAGYDHKIVQDLVNKGYDYKITVEDIEASYAKFGKTFVSTTANSSDAAKEQAKSILELSDAQLKEMGYTEEQISMLRALAKESLNTGKSISDLAKEMESADGRTLLLDSFKNFGKAVSKIFKQLKLAWQDIFPPKTAEEKSVALYNFIKALNEFSKKLIISDERADQLRRTFRGLFSIIKLISIIVGGPIKIAFNILKQVLGFLGLDFLEFTAILGDGLVKFTNWVNHVIDFTRVFKLVSGPIIKAIKAFRNWIDVLKTSDNIPRDIMLGLVNGLKGGISFVGKILVEIVKYIIDLVKKLFGIHSPSTVFAGIGKNIIEGLIKGLEVAFTSIPKVLKSIVTMITNVFRGMDASKLILGALGVGIIFAVVKIAGAIKSLSGPLEGFGEMMSGLGASLKANAWKKKAAAVKSIAVAIAILVASVVVLTKIKTGALWAAIGALAALGVIVVALAVAASKLGEIDSMGKSMGSIAAVGIALLLMAMALQKLCAISPESMASGIKAMVGIVAMMIALMVAMGTMSKLGRHVDNMGGMLMKMAAAFLIMGLVIRFLGAIKKSVVSKGVGVIISIGIVFSAFIAVSKFAGKYGSEAGSMLLKMSVAMLIMNTVIRKFGELDASTVKKGIKVVAEIEVLFMAVVAVSSIAGKNASKAGTMLLTMSVALMIMVGVMFVISLLDAHAVEKGLIAIGALTVCMDSMIALTSLIKDPEKTKKVLTVLLASIVILTGVTVLLGLLDSSKVMQGIAAITALILCFETMMAMTKVMNSSKDIAKNLIVLTVVVAALAGVIYLLSKVKATNALASSAAISAVLLAFSSSLLIISKTGEIAKSALTGIIVMMAVTAFIAAILTLMSALDVTASIESATAIGLLLNSMASALLILDQTTSISNKSLATLGIMGLIAGEVGLILGLLEKFNLGPSIETAIAIGVLLNAMSSSMLILSVAGKAGSSAFVGIAAFETFIVATSAIMVGIGALVDLCPSIQTFVDKAVPLLAKVGEGIGIFFGSIVGGVIEGVASGLPAVGQSLSSFMTNAQVFIQGASTIPEGVISGVASLAGAILVITAAEFMAGILSFLSGGDAIGNFSAQLPILGQGMQSFAASIVGMDIETVRIGAEAIKVLAEASAAIPNTGGLLGAIVGENDMGEWAKQLKPMGTGLCDFCTELTSGSFDPEVVTTGANAIKTLAQASQEIPNTGGLLGAIVGENDMGEWAKQLKPMGTGLSDFCTELLKGEFNTDVVNSGANAIKILAQASQEIPNTGGLLGLIVGDNDMEDWAKQLKPMGTGLSDFCTELLKSGKFDTEVVNTGANAIKTLAQASKELPNTGGLLGLLVGDIDMKGWGDDLKYMGSGIAKFAKELVGVNIESVKIGADAAKKLAEVTKSLPKGGLVRFFSGKSDAAKNFANDCKELGQAIKKYSDGAKGVNANVVEKTVPALKSLADLVKSKSLSTETAKGFNKAIEHIADCGRHMYNLAIYLVDVDFTMFEKFCTAVNMIGTLCSISVNSKEITDTANALSLILDCMKGMAEIPAGATDGFVQSIQNLANINLDALSTALVDGAAKVEEAGSAAIDAFISGINKDLAGDARDAINLCGSRVPEMFKNGIDDNITTVRETCRGLAEECVLSVQEGIEDSLWDIKDAINTATATFVTECTSALINLDVPFVDAGEDAADGFAEGIESGEYTVKIAGVSLAEAALEAIKSTLNINSPSREMRELGYSGGEGFVAGLDKYVSIAEEAGRDMANSSITGLRDSMNRLASIVTPDMSIEPTITPVIDLSNVDSSMKSINSMFSQDRILRVNGRRVDNISSGVMEIQNRRNDDLASAIKGLRKDVVNMPRNNYSIGNISYEEGSDVAEALQTIIRATRVGKRV